MGGDALLMLLGLRGRIGWLGRLLESLWRERYPHSDAPVRIQYGMALENSGTLLIESAFDWYTFGRRVYPLTYTCVVPRDKMCYSMASAV